MMTFDWTFSVGNVLTIIGFLGGGLLAWGMINTQVALLAQRLSAAESDLSDIRQINEKVATLAIKTDAMWEFQMRRGKSEAVMSGLATVNSPVKINETAWSVIADLVEPLQNFYAKLPNSKKLSDSELGLEIEQAFGNRLLHEICIPHKLSMGACLIIAIAVAKDSRKDNCDSPAGGTDGYS